MMTDQPRQRVASLAHCCELWSCGYGVLFDELQRRGIEPALVINEVPHYHTDDLERTMCDLENENRVPRRQIHFPAQRVKIIEPAAGSHREEIPPPCPRRSS